MDLDSGPAVVLVNRGLLKVKDSVAATLRDEIIKGRLQPGDRVVEGKWAKTLGVAQSSIRDAINTLAGEGFLVKGSSRSATVTLLTPEDVNQIYRLRAVLEGLSARLIVERSADLADLELLVEDMRAAVACKNIQAFYDRDLRFHLLICEKAGNKYLEQDLRRLLVPLFAFVIIRVHGRDDNPETWRLSIAQHEQLLEAIRSQDPDVAERQARAALSEFFHGTDALLQRQAIS
jgi:DNA-binding GntR family transcriptional regulator